MIASGWRPVARGSLLGFFDLLLASGIRLQDCMLFEKGDRRWIGLPGKPQLEDGQHRKDPATGRGLYTAVIEIPDRAARDKFTEQALAAVDRLLHTDGTP